MRKIPAILLVDDDRISNALHSLLIKEMDLAERILVSQNGREALEFLTNPRKLDEFSITRTLILLDVNMPVMSGFELLEELHRLTTFSQLITNNIAMLSSSADPRDVRKARLLGVNQYLNKPLTEVGLLQLIQPLLR